MLDIKRILVASDMSAHSALAENRAAKLCRRFGLKELELVNVQDTGFADLLGRILGSTEKKSEELVVERVTKDFEPIRQRILNTFGITATVRVLFGRPSIEIANYARKNSVDLIVTGARRPGIGQHFFPGNTPDRLLHVTPVPLLIVRQNPEKPYQNALIPVDFSENAKYAARVATRIMLPAARKFFLHIYNVPNEGLMRYANVSAGLIGNLRVEAKKKAEEKMAELVASLESDNRVSWSVQYGETLKMIADDVNARHPDLIIMGKQGQANLEALLLGSITRSMVNETSCDILVIPLKTDAPASA